MDYYFVKKIMKLKSNAVYGAFIFCELVFFYSYGIICIFFKL